MLLMGTKRKLEQEAEILELKLHRIEIAWKVFGYGYFSD